MRVRRPIRKLSNIPQMEEDGGLFVSIQMYPVQIATETGRTVK